MEIPSLTDRQIQILKLIIEEYIKSGEAVGSDTIDKKYNLGVSPATIRNEMVILGQQGFLDQPHTSSGRTPTPLALRFYVKQLMREKDLSVSEEVDVKAKIWDYREKADSLLREAVRILAYKTGTIAVATTNHGDVFHAGYANILDLPEFYDIDVTKTVLMLLDNTQQLQEILGRALGQEPINILLGDDFESEFMRPCGVIYTRFPMGNYGEGALGVFGPSRLDYAYIIPMVRYFGTLLADLTHDW